jgi:hypothetical protein
MNEEKFMPYNHIMTCFDVSITQQLFKESTSIIFKQSMTSAETSISARDNRRMLETTTLRSSKEAVPLRFLLLI